MPFYILAMVLKTIPLSTTPFGWNYCKYEYSHYMYNDVRI